MQKAPILTLTAAALAVAAFLVVRPLAAWQDPAKSAEKPAPASPQPSGNAEATGRKILQEARDRLRGYRSIKAELKEVITIGRDRFEAKGTYLQGQNLQIRLALNIRAGSRADMQASLLQVCDGSVLWTVHEVAGAASEKSDAPPEQRITRRSVTEILEAAARNKAVPENMLVAELGLGGLSELLASIEQTVDIKEVRTERVGDDTFRVLEGRWKNTVLQQFVALEEIQKLAPAAPLSALPRLPEHVPDVVRIYLGPTQAGEEDGELLFPRIIRYLKRPEGRDYLKPMVTLTLEQVAVNGALDDNAFNYVPPATQEDITSEYIQRIEQAGNSGSGLPVVPPKQE